jgi:hypothetical protein
MRAIFKPLSGIFCMENPRTINRFLLGLLAIYGAVAIGGSVFLGDVSVLFYSIAATALIFIGFGLVAIINVIVFAPIFWLMARSTPHKSKRGNLEDRAV